MMGVTGQPGADQLRQGHSPVQRQEAAARRPPAHSCPRRAGIEAEDSHLESTRLQGVKNQNRVSLHRGNSNPGRPSNPALAPGPCPDHWAIGPQGRTNGGPRGPPRGKRNQGARVETQGGPRNKGDPFVARPRESSSPGPNFGPGGATTGCGYQKATFGIWAGKGGLARGNQIPFPRGLAKTSSSLQRRAKEITRGGGAQVPVSPREF